MSITLAGPDLLHAQDEPCPKKMMPGGGASIGGVSASGTTSGIDDHPRVLFAIDNDHAKQLAVEVQQDNPRGRMAMTLFKEFEHDGHTQWRKIGRLARFEKSGKGAKDIRLPQGRYTLVFTGKDVRYAVTLREKPDADNAKKNDDKADAKSDGDSTIIASKTGVF